MDQNHLPRRHGGDDFLRASHGARRSAIRRSGTARSGGLAGGYGVPRHQPDFRRYRSGLRSESLLERCIANARIPRHRRGDDAKAVVLDRLNRPARIESPAGCRRCGRAMRVSRGRCPPRGSRDRRAPAKPARRGI